jgi:hypothetical protein
MSMLAWHGSPRALLSAVVALLSHAHLTFGSDQVLERLGEQPLTGRETGQQRSKQKGWHDTNAGRGMH